MEKSNILTQEELKDLTSKSDEMSSAIIKPIDFFNREKIIKSEYSAIDNIHSKFAKHMTEQLFQLLSSDIEVFTGEMQPMEYTQVISSMASPFSFNIIDMKPLRGHPIIIFDQKFIDLVIIHYFGGSRVSDKVEREISPMDLQILAKVLNEMVKEIQSAWMPIRKCNVGIKQAHVNPQLNKNYTDDALFLVLNFKVDFGSAEGTFLLAYPFMMLETLRENLSESSNRSLDESDPNWSQTLKKNMLDTSLDVTAVLAEKEISLKEILDWKPDDVVLLEKPKEHDVYIGGELLYKGTLGTNHEKNCVKITRIIKS